MYKDKFETAVVNAAKAFFKGNFERNFYAAEFFPEITIFGNPVNVETIWYQKEEDEFYLHCDDKEFEGDIKLTSLSERNLEKILATLMCIMYS